MTFFASQCLSSFLSSTDACSLSSIKRREVITASTFCQFLSFFLSSTNTWSLSSIERGEVIPASTDTITQDTQTATSKALREIAIFSLILTFFWNKFEANFLILFCRFSLEFFPLMNFILRTIHQIIDSFTPWNCKFLSLFLSFFPIF